MRRGLQLRFLGKCMECESPYYLNSFIAVRNLNKKPKKFLVFFLGKQKKSFKSRVKRKLFNSFQSSVLLGENLMKLRYENLIR